jgi:hypothetical protein
MLLEDVFIFTIAGGVVLFFTWGIIHTRRSEKKEWNNGVCPYCGKPWKMFDTDSSGARGYKCENMHYCWITYKVDK